MNETVRLPKHYASMASSPSTPPSNDAPRRSAERGTLGPVAQVVFRASLALTGLVLLLLLVDIGLDWHLPQPLRMTLPYALLVGLLVALTLGVGAFGAARRPERPTRPETGMPSEGDPPK